MVQSNEKGQNREATDHRNFRRITEMNKDDRPRERLMAYGPEVLSNAELMAIIIGTGTKSQTAIDLSRSILEICDQDLSAFYNTDVMELVQYPRLHGIGPGKACKIKAAIELGKRVRSERKGRPFGGNPEAVALYLTEKMLWYEKEVVRVLLLDAKLKIFDEEEVAVGTATASLIHPREVFSPAVRRRAVSVIVAHNHPSGDPAPSGEDIEVTKRLDQAGTILGIQLIDHIIIGNGDYFSFQESGLL